MKKLLIIIIFALCHAGISAQNKWYLAPSAGAAIADNDVYFSAGLTAGRYLGENNRYRVDVWGAGIFSDDSGIYSVAALFTLGEFTSMGKWIATASAGAGIQKSELKDDADFIIPIRTNYAYRLTDNMALGLDLSVSLNLSGRKGGTPTYLGLFLGFRI